MYGGLTKEEWQAIVPCKHWRLTVNKKCKQCRQTAEEQRKMAAVDMEGVDLSNARMENAHLRGAQLKGADLRGAQLKKADLTRTQLEGAYLGQGERRMSPRLADTSWADEEGIGPQLVNIRWGDVNLAVVKWSQMKKLGDEYEAQQKKYSEDIDRPHKKGEVKGNARRLEEYEAAVRANRQLAVALQDQGLNEDAARFAYHAQILQRKVFWYQVRECQVRQLGAYLFSGFLALLTGYGYRIWRIFAVYGCLIVVFAAIYYFFSPGFGHHLTWYQQVYQALVVSVTAFHGRTYAGQYGPDTVLGGVAALEGIVGLVIEGVFIAMLVQRFFGK